MTGAFDGTADDATRGGRSHVYCPSARGAQTAAAFLAADLVDALEIYRAPIVIGDGLRAIGALDLADLAEAHGRWQLVEQARVGSDEFAAYRRSR